MFLIFIVESLLDFLDLIFKLKYEEIIKSIINIIIKNIVKKLIVLFFNVNKNFNKKGVINLTTSTPKIPKAILFFKQTLPLILNFSLE